MLTAVVMNEVASSCCPCGVWLTAELGPFFSGEDKLGSSTFQNIMVLIYAYNNIKCMPTHSLASCMPQQSHYIAIEGKKKYM